MIEGLSLMWLFVVTAFCIVINKKLTTAIGILNSILTAMRRLTPSTHAETVPRGAAHDVPPLHHHSL
jgi:hypothetical protein